MSGAQEKAGLDSIFLTQSIMVQIKNMCMMYEFAHDTELEDCLLIKVEENKIFS